MSRKVSLLRFKDKTNYQLKKDFHIINHFIKNEFENLIFTNYVINILNHKFSFEELIQLPTSFKVKVTHLLYELNEGDHCYSFLKCIFSGNSNFEDENELFLDFNILFNGKLPLFMKNCEFISYTDQVDDHIHIPEIKEFYEQTTKILKTDNYFNDAIDNEIIELQLDLSLFNFICYLHGDLNIKKIKNDVLFTNVFYELTSFMESSDYNDWNIFRLDIICTINKNVHNKITYFIDNKIAPNEVRSKMKLFPFLFHLANCQKKIKLDNFMPQYFNKSGNQLLIESIKEYI